MLDFRANEDSREDTTIRTTELGQSIDAMPIEVRAKSIRVEVAFQKNQKALFKVKLNQFSAQEN